MKRLLLCAAVAVVALTGCKAKVPGTTSAPASAPVPSTAPAAAPVAAAPAAPGFDVVIAMTPQAASTLAAANQTVIVSVDYYGVDNDPANQDQAMLAPSARVETPATGGTAHFVVPPIDAAALAKVPDGKTQILVNVFSGQNGNPDNKLDCGLYQGDIAVAERAPVAIACKVIGEGG